MKKLLASLLIALGVAATAQAQQTLLQGGSFSAGHLPAYAGQGTAQPIVVDSGSSAGGAQGVNIATIGVTARASGTPPFANSGAGPNAENFCMYDGPTNAAAGYHYLCLDPHAQGGGLLSYGAGGAASNLGLSFIVNGTTYTFPFSSGSGVVGPGTTVIGDTACWNNLVGTLLSDCGQINLNGSTSGKVVLKAAAIAGANTLTLPAGTTDFSATGGTSQVVKQTSSGGAFTVAQLAASDLSNSTTGTGAIVLANTPTLITPVIGAATGTSLTVSAQLTSQIATGTAPLVVASTTNVANLNASSLSGATFASPGAIGSGTPSTGVFTTLTANTSFSAATLSPTSASCPVDGIDLAATHTLGFCNNSTLTAALDANGRLLMGGLQGTTAQTGTGANVPVLQVQYPGNAAIGMFRYSADAQPSNIEFLKSRGTSAGTYTIVQNGDVITRIRGGAADGVKFVNAGNIEFRIDAAPGVDDMPTAFAVSLSADGSATPTDRLTISDAGAGVLTGTLNVTTSISSAVANITGKTTTGVLEITDTGTVANGFLFPASGSISMNTASSEAWRVNSTQQFLVGYSVATANLAGSNTPVLNVFTNSSLKSPIAAQRFSADTGGANVVIVKSRSAVLGTNTIVQSGDTIGGMQYEAADGATYVQAAIIRAAVDGTPGVNDMPGRLEFQTTPDGSNTPIEAMRIDNTQLIRYTAIVTDATHTDATVCVDTTSKGLYFGSGAAGICLGTSSRRYKHHIADIDDGLSAVMELKPISYYYRPDSGNDPNHELYGFLAEDMAPVIPKLVRDDKEGRPNSIDMVGMIPVLVKAIQEQQKQIAAISAKQ